MCRVFIFGAGASAGYVHPPDSNKGIHPPVAGNFFQTVGELYRESGLPQDFGDLWGFLKKYYGINERMEPSPDIEEVLTLLDIGDRKKDARQQLLKLIAITFEKIIVNYESDKFYSKIVEQLTGNDVIITFNWDLLVDNRMASSNNGPNYGVNLLEPVLSRGMETTSGNLLLKPHGSMNWMTCRKCKTNYAYIMSGKTVAQHSRGEPILCHNCDDETEPLMIPPTLIKNYSHPVIEAVWKKADRVLRKASEIVVVGYSLPVTDFKVKWLFMNASANRKATLRKLTIIDKPCPDESSASPALKEKFKRVFLVDKDTTVQAKYCDVGCVKKVDEVLECVFNG